MDDVALYTVYNSHYHLQSAEAQLASSVQRSRQGAVCACLAFGAVCGLSTVAGGLFAKNPAVTWPVVAVGLVGVVIGIVLAHRQATGGWSHRQLSPQQQQRQGGNVSEQQQRQQPGSCQPLYDTPMYCAEALDVDMAWDAETECTDFSGEAGRQKGSGEEVQDEDDPGHHQHPQPRPKPPSPPCGDSKAQSVGLAIAATTANPAGVDSSDAAAMAVVAVGFGVVVCGVPLAGADGIVDPKPVLVLQPHTQLVRYGYGCMYGHVCGQQYCKQPVANTTEAAQGPIPSATAATAVAATAGTAESHVDAPGGWDTSPAAASFGVLVPTTARTRAALDAESGGDEEAVAAGGAERPASSSPSSPQCLFPFPSPTPSSSQSSSSPPTLLTSRATSPSLRVREGQGPDERSRKGPGRAS